MPDRVIAKAASDLHDAVEDIGVLVDQVKSMRTRTRLLWALVLLVAVVAGWSFNSSRIANDAATKAKEATATAKATDRVAAKLACEASNDFRHYQQQQLDERANTPVFDVTALPAYQLLAPEVRAYVDGLGAVLAEDHIQDVDAAETYRRDFPIRDCASLPTVQDPNTTTTTAG